jgi:hypothetical protein
MNIDLLKRARSILSGDNRQVSWARFSLTFLTVFGGGAIALYAFVLLMDPYHDVPFSLPIERPLMSVNQRYMYPQVARSKRFDSFIVGTSTSRLIDPQILSAGLTSRFVNLAMDSATAWEQTQIAQYFIRKSGAPKVMIVGADYVWCTSDADTNRTTFRGFPDFLYDDNRWNDLQYLMNSRAIEIAGRLVGYHLGVLRERSRYDGYQVFVPPETSYDLARAQTHIWGGPPRTLPDPTTTKPYTLSDKQRAAARFPALTWLDELFAAAPSATKVVAFMPVHAAGQPLAGSMTAAVEAMCKDTIVGIARRHDATVIDWRIPSVLTTNDSNYWDPLHYRVPVAQRISRDLADAVIDGRPSTDGTYKILHASKKPPVNE